MHSDAATASMLRALQQASLGGDGVTMPPACELALAASFGSVQRWRDEFSAISAPDGRSGWVLLVFRDGLLVNQRVDETANVAGMPLLAFERCQSGAGRVDAFLADIDWSAFYARYRSAVEAAAEGLAADADNVGGAELIDVRRAGAYAKGDTQIAGARWRDPVSICDWAGELAAGQPVVVYCVYGHEVSQAAALRLRAQGLPARFLRDGIEQWAAAGRPLQPKSAVSAEPRIAGDRP
jgi:Fe-Mn family superoxide dismutase